MGNLLKHGSMRAATLVTTASVLGVWVFANVVSYLSYLEVVRHELASGTGAELPAIPEILPIPGWVVTMLGAVFGAKQIEKHMETRGQVVLPPPDR